MALRFGVNAVRLMAESRQPKERDGKRHQHQSGGAQVRRGHPVGVVQIATRRRTDHAAQAGERRSQAEGAALIVGVRQPRHHRCQRRVVEAHANREHPKGDQPRRQFQTSSTLLPFDATFIPSFWMDATESCAGSSAGRWHGKPRTLLQTFAQAWALRTPRRMSGRRAITARRRR